MSKTKFKLTEEIHGFPENKYNKHTWVLGNPKIGDDVWIGAFTLIDAKHDKLTIGKGCDVSSGAQILTHTTVRRCLSARKIDKIDTAPVEIGEYVFIGTSAVILMGAKIGHHSVIGANCLVSQYMVVPPYSIVMGVPGRIVGSSKKYLKKIKTKTKSKARKKTKSKKKIKIGKKA